MLIVASEIVAYATIFGGPRLDRPVLCQSNLDHDRTAADRAGGVGNLKISGPQGPGPILPPSGLGCKP